MLEALFTTGTSSTITTPMAFFYTIMAGVLGVLISLTYLKTGKVSKNFARTLIILPMLVCVVMLVVNGNLGTSVAIVGAFSLIRFRSLQGNSRDIAFVFFAMTIGLTCSVGYLVFAIGIAVLVCFVLFLLQVAHYGEQKICEKELKVTIPENLDYSGIFDDIFAEYTSKCKMVRVKTTNMGSLYEVTYHMEMNDDTKEKQMIDDIRCRNGNLTVICGRCDFNAADEL